MLSPRQVVMASTIASASAVNLFIADYGGTVTSAALTSGNGSYSLVKTHGTTACSPNPSWLTIDPANRLLFCLNEGLTSPNGSLSSFTIDASGALNHVQNTTTISGPVSGIIYGAGDSSAHHDHDHDHDHDHKATAPNNSSSSSSNHRAIALAHYTGSAVSAWTLSPTQPGAFSLLQEQSYTLAHPGPVPDRQEAPHEHEAILDPTAQYLLVPDLGADLVRVFAWDVDTLKLEAREPLHAKPGSGPRHAAFRCVEGAGGGGRKTFFYLVAELASTVTGYEVTYLPGEKAGLAFKEVYVSTTYGDRALPAGNAPAEVHVSPDNNFLVISNRGDNSFTIPTPDGSGGTIESDAISTFSFNDNGTLALHQLSPAGGSYPRQFSMNADGSLVAVGLQYDQRVVVMERDVATGLIGDVVATLPVGGNVTCVMWDEEERVRSLGGGW